MIYNQLASANCELPKADERGLNDPSGLQFHQIIDMLLFIFCKVFTRLAKVCLAAEGILNRTRQSTVTCDDCDVHCEFSLI